MNKIEFRYVNKTLENETKDFIIHQYMNFYGKRISAKQYEVLYEKMGKLLSNTHHNAFFIAQNEKKEIIAAISVSKYDNRIEKLQDKYAKRNIAEIGRCYVKPQYQRVGVASKLFNIACIFAKKVSYEKLYLHTHYFLPGGFHFWQKMGFLIVDDEKDELQTVHMERKLNDISNKNLFENNSLFSFDETILKYK